MKKNSLIAALAVAAMFTSCSKESSLDTQIATPAKISLEIVSNGALSKKSFGYDPQNMDNSIEEVTAFFVRADGSFDRPPVVAKEEYPFKLVDVPVTSLLQDVYVVANANDAVKNGITDLASLRSKLLDIDDGSGNCTQRAPTSESDGFYFGSKICQVGSAAARLYTKAGVDDLDFTRITLKFVPARIQVTVNNSMTGSDVTLDSISIINAPAQSLLFSESGGPLDMPNKKYVWGLPKGSRINFPAGTDFSKSYYTSTELDKPFFYVFPNKASSYSGDLQPTIVVVNGTFKDKPIYFPVRFDGNDVEHHIESGKAYDLTITLKGDASEGGGGTTDPTVSSRFVKGTVTPARWEFTVVQTELN